MHTYTKSHKSICTWADEIAWYGKVFFRAVGNVFEPHLSLNFETCFQFITSVVDKDFINSQ